MKNILIVGSSGQAKVTVDIIRKEGKYNLVGFLDRFRKVGEQTMGVPVLGKEEDLPDLIKKHQLEGIIIAIGDNFIRSRVAAGIEKICPDFPFVSTVHPAASIADQVKIGEGSVVMAGVSVNSCVSVGRCCILNTNSSLDHDSVMGDFSSLAPGVTTGGNCNIGSWSAIGIGALVIQGMEIGEHSVVGAGSLVLKPIGSSVVAYGSPAQVIRKRNAGDKYL